MAHALLSPSGASRWLNCTPSAQFETQFPNRGSRYADEGTHAHKLGELLLREKLGLVEKKDFKRKLKELQASEHYTEAMLDHCEDYAVLVMEKYNEAQTHTKDAQIALEVRLNMTDYVPEGFGTGDAVIIADNVLDLIDLKYGQGVPVSSVENKQMMLYGLGALYDYHHIYKIHTVRMTIFQPRIDNVSTWEIPVKDLFTWAETVLKPAAAKAFNGEGDFVPGNHCQFCKARAVCKANADMHLELAKYEFADVQEKILTDADIADILSRAKAFENWIGAVKEHALHEAIHNGKKWPGFKLVEGRSNRVYVDESKVADTLLKAGFAENIIYKPKKLLGITEMEKTVTKKVFAEQLKDLVVKPEGKPTLAPESDKRTEISSLDAAKREFEMVDVTDD